MWTVISETGVPPLRADTKISHEAARSVSFPPLSLSLRPALRSVISKLPSSPALHTLLTNSCGSEPSERTSPARRRNSYVGKENNESSRWDRPILHTNFRSALLRCINTRRRRKAGSSGDHECILRSYPCWEGLPLYARLALSSGQWQGRSIVHPRMEMLIWPRKREEALSPWACSLLFRSWICLFLRFLMARRTVRSSRPRECIYSWVFA